MVYKIAIVIPTITTISGNRTAFLLAKELNTYMPCVLICYEIEESQIKIVENLLSPVHLFYKKKLKNGEYSKAKGLKDQFLRKRDRDLSKFILQKNYFDVVLIISNEGKYLSNYLKKKNLEIITAISIMEMNDHFLFVPYRNKKRLITYRQTLFSFFYGVLRYFERERFLSFDLIFANSTWTAILFQYLYNINVVSNIIMIDNRLFKPVETRKFLDKFIAVPTVSLEGDIFGQQIVTKLVSDGIPIVSYGGFKIDNIPYLGYLNTNDMIQLLSDANGTLFLFDYEALGLVPFESLACGTKVITYNIQGPASELRDNNNVFFCNNYSEIKDACLTILNEDKDKGSIKNCVNSVSKYFPENTANNIFNVINNYKSQCNKNRY